MLYVMRAFFIAILSGSLLLFDFSYKGIETKKVYAEEIKDSNMYATLTMSATGLIASRLFTYPKLTPDMIAAAVGGAAFIAGEIAAYMQFRDQLKDFEMEIVRDDQGNIDNKQIETIEKLLQSYEKGKETAETKKTLQQAAAAAFAVAAALAAYQAATDESTQTACLTGLNSAISAGMTACTAAWQTQCAAECAGTTVGYAACVAGCVSAGVAADCTPCETALNLKLSNIMSIIAGRETPSPSMAAMTSLLTLKSTVTANDAASCNGVHSPATMKTMSISSCTPYLTTPYINLGGGMIKLLGQSKPNHLIPNSLIVFLINQIIKESSASTFSAPLSAMGIASSVAVAFVMANSLTLSNFVDLNVLIPKRRMFIWAALAATSFMASTATDNVIQKIEANIQKIKSILARMYQLHPGSFANKPYLVDALKGKLTPIKKITEVAINNVDANGKIIEGTKGKLPCVMGEANGKCADVEAAMQKMDGFNSLPAELKNETKGVMDLGKALNGADKISSGALDAAGKLANKANAISDRAKAQRKRLQDVLNSRKDKNGKSPNYNFEKNTDDLRKAIFKDIDKNMKKKGLTEASVASMFGSEMAATLAAEANGKNKDNKGNVVDLSGAQGAKPTEDPNKDLASMDLAAEDVAGISADELTDAAGATGEAKDMTEEYDLSSNVHTDPEVNIFDIISKRYMSTGYKRLLQRKNMK